MKKFSFIGSALLFATVITFLSIGCQKEASVADEPVVAADNEAAALKAIDGGSSAISGLISEQNAQRMAAEFVKQNPNAKTLAVGYATKDLIAFLKVLNNKYKADSVYVTFGIYDAKTAHKPSQIGRTTVFFMGNNKLSSGAIRTNESTTGDEPSNYLNGGTSIPN